MSLQAELMEKILRLPEDKQLLVKALVDELVRKREPTLEGEPPVWFGSLEHFGIRISGEGIAEAQREMWDQFPREVH